ncbi:MAG: DUF2062 domain-containing protein [Gammaproteobacteria bacterium]|nr:DUF2062 domain-containing protein [Gammaproteobacteria bacterium]MCP5425103.1 DUF2062 domain-containing protein [Gammaproteobacteria bacterium]
MVKRFIKRYVPEHQDLKEQTYLRLFGSRLHDPNLWHLNRRSVAGALGVGMFVAFIPLPGQAIIAAAAAIALRINLPLAVATIFITNPLTIPPFFYATYRLGAWLLGIPHRPFEIELSLSWLWHETGLIWLPLLVGSLTTGVVLGLLVYGSVRLLWRISVIRRRRSRPLKNPKTGINI